MHDTGFKKISDLFPEEDLLLDLYGVLKSLVLVYLFAGFNAALVKHIVVSCEGLHHGFEEAAVKHKGRFVYAH